MKHFVFLFSVLSLLSSRHASAFTATYQLQHYDTLARTCVGVTGATVSVQNCGDTSASGSLWLLNYKAGSVPSGKFQLKNSNSGLCITRTGSALVQSPCGNSASPNQFFSFVYMGNGVNEVVESTTGLCIASYPDKVGNPFVLVTCDKTPKLEFHLNEVALGVTLPPYSAVRHVIADENATSGTSRAYADHAGLYFGSMIDPTGDHFLSDPQMQSIAASQFNIMEPGTQLKWSRIHPAPNTYDFSGADALLNFAKQNGLKVRGHNLTWDVANPAWLTDGNFTPTQLQSILINHIQTVVGHFKSKYPGVITSWDVVNEPIGWNDLYNGNNIIWSQIGQNPDRADYIRLAFKVAHAMDPNANLCINDYRDEGSIDATRSQNLFNLVKELKSEGIPINCVGFESHLGNYGGGYQLPVNSKLQAMIAQYASIGIQVQFTEFDFVEPNSAIDVSLAQTISYNMLQSCIAASNCTVFNNWGYSQKYLGHDWGSNSTTMLMYDFNQLVDPVYSVFRSVLKNAAAAVP